MSFKAPVNDVRFALNHVVDFGKLAQTETFAETAAGELVDQILEEAGKFASEILAPLSAPGDHQGSKFEDGVVTTPDGWPEAYGQFVEGGWNCVAGPEDFGGMALPMTMQSAVFEFVSSANMAFGLCPLLTQAAIHALEVHGTPEQQETYLPKLITGEWSGSMNLTEPQAGSDVGALTTKAEPNGDGSYSVTGQKIFITYGEHDCAENIIHLVLARLPDAPIGTRGISLFLIPKYFVNADGSLGARNTARAISIEGKLGIHASPTCVMSYDSARGWLIGAENKGMAAMFTMMNDARVGVGIQGVGVIERAYQGALAFAADRRQGKPLGKQHEQKDMVAIVEHADVRRMLFQMKATVEAARAICLDTALHSDLAKAAGTAKERDAAATRADLLTPVAKAWSTDKAVEMASVGIQIHGGMGFIEETGAAQHLRDARITPIYEGTNGIQAMDLIGRKLPMTGGAGVKAYLAEIADIAEQCGRSNDSSLVTIASHLSEGHAALVRTTDWMLQTLKSGEANDAMAGSVPYLSLFGAVSGGMYLAKGALAAHEETTSNGHGDYLETRIRLAQFFAETEIPPAIGLETTATRGAGILYSESPDRLAS